jgi:hypothetical protein
MYLTVNGAYPSVAGHYQSNTQYNDTVSRCRSERAGNRQLIA